LEKGDLEGAAKPLLEGLRIFAGSKLEVSFETGLKELRSTISEPDGHMLKNVKQRYWAESEKQIVLKIKEYQEKKAPKNQHTVRPNELPENWVIHLSHPQGLGGYLDSDLFGIAFHNVKSRPSNLGFTEDGPHIEDFPIGKIFKVRPDSPAAKAGILPGDVLNSIGGISLGKRAVVSMTNPVSFVTLPKENELKTFLSELRAGDDFEAVLLRSGKETKVKVSLDGLTAERHPQSLYLADAMGLQSLSQEVSRPIYNYVPNEKISRTLDDSKAVQAILACGRNRDTKAIPLLADTLRGSPFFQHRMYAAMALGAIGTKKSVEALEGAEKIEPFYFVRHWIQAAKLRASESEMQKN
jgi:hypothetical protein